MSNKFRQKIDTQVLVLNILTEEPSVKFVTMVIRRIFSCQTICQKSSTVFIFGPIICKYLLKNCHKVKSNLHNKYNDTQIIFCKCQYTLWCNVCLFTTCILKENECICRVEVFPFNVDIHFNSLSYVCGRGKCTVIYLPKQILPKR